MSPISHERKTRHRPSRREALIWAVCAGVARVLRKRVVKSSILFVSVITAFVAQLGQQKPCKFPFVSSTLTEGSRCYLLAVRKPDFQFGNTGSNPVSTEALITQLAEYAPLKRRVGGSNPPESMLFRVNAIPDFARVAQWTEQTVDNRSVESLNLSSCSIFARRLTGRTSDLGSENLGSNPSKRELWISSNGKTWDCGSQNVVSTTTIHPKSGGSSLDEAVAVLSPTGRRH
jgi:hypothetical protein